MEKQASLSPVSIVGAGPGGLLLARYLQIHHIPCVIYEREDSRDSRNQGGSLDLHQDTGLQALRETELYDQAAKLLRPEGEATKIVDDKGVVWADENAEDQQGATGGRPEIDRTELRDLLLDSLEPDTVKWGHGLKATRALDNDTYELTFLDPALPPITTSLLVGADGAWSRVRPLLHTTKPAYGGTTWYDLHIPAANMTPSLRDFVGAGMVIAVTRAGGTCVVGQMNAGGAARIYVMLVKPEEWAEEHPLPDTGKREHVDALVEGWCNGMLHEAIFASVEERVSRRKIFAFDPKIKWTSDLTGVTIIGDAAHVTHPNGEGVNQAMADALELGKTLVALYTSPTSSSSASLPPFPLSLFPVSPPPTTELHEPLRPALHAALRAFEKSMMHRNAKEMRSGTWFNSIILGPRALTFFYCFGLALRVARGVMYPLNTIRRMVSGQGKS